MIRTKTSGPASLEGSGQDSSRTRHRARLGSRGPHGPVAERRNMKWLSGTNGKDIWATSSLSESTTAAHRCQGLSNRVQRRQTPSDSDKLPSTVAILGTFLTPILYRGVNRDGIKPSRLAVRSASDGECSRAVSNSEVILPSLANYALRRGATRHQYRNAADT